MIADFIKALPQAIATVIAASLVLGGVIATLRQNQRRHNEELKDGRRKLRHAQLENRAKELQAVLQDKYAEFAAIGFKILSESIFLRQAREQLVQFRKEAKEAEGGPDDALMEAHDKLSDEYRLRSQGYIEMGLQLSASVIGINLRDDDIHRQHQLEGLYARIMSADEAQPIAIKRKIDLDVRAFMESVRDGLEAKYQRDADLAEHGKYPIPPVRTRSSPEIEPKPWQPAAVSESETQPSKT